ERLFIREGAFGGSAGESDLPHAAFADKTPAEPVSAGRAPRSLLRTRESLRTGPVPGIGNGRRVRPPARSHPVLVLGEHRQAWRDRGSDPSARHARGGDG